MLKNKNERMVIKKLSPAIKLENVNGYSNIQISTAI